jgi:hypothetical protein
MYGRLVGLRAGMERYGEKEKKSFVPAGIRNPKFPAQSESIYRLRYPVHTFRNTRIFNTSSTRVLYTPKKKYLILRQQLRLLTPGVLAN